MNQSIASQLAAAGESPRVHQLSASCGEFRAAPPAARPREIAGQPCSYFWKDLISPGEYENAVRGFTLSATSRRLEKWAQTGRRMLEAGINIPIVCDHSEKARDAVGRVIDFKMESGCLKALCQFIGADAPILAARNEVSIGVAEHFIDGQGRNWGDAIIHVALTPAPVVPGQQPFVKAASRAAQVSRAVQGPADDAHDAAGLMLLRPIEGVRQLSSATIDNHHERRSLMSKTLLPCSDECLAALHRHVPGLEHASNKEKLSHLAQHLSSFKDSIRKLCDMAEESPDSAPANDGANAGSSNDNDADEDTKLLSLLARKLQAAADRAAAAEARVLELDRASGDASAAGAANSARVDPELLGDRAELTVGRIDLALSRGELTPAIANKLKAKVQTAGRPNVYLLSRNDELGMRPVDFFLDLLAGQKLIPIGAELSGAQTLSRTPPSDDPTASEQAASELPFKTMAARHNARVA